MSAAYTHYTAPTSLPGDFASEPSIDQWDREMLEDAYKAVTKTPQGWEILARSDVPGEGGFMFSEAKDPQVKSVLKTIDSNLQYGGHSGASYGCTMRNMEFIAKNGWDALMLNYRLGKLKDELNNTNLTKSQKKALYDIKEDLGAMLQMAKTKHQRAHSPPTPVSPTPALPTIVEQVETVGAFLQNVQPNASITEFATQIQNDPGMRAMIPDIDEQAEALRRFSEGKLSYAEMRALCG